MRLYANFQFQNPDNFSDTLRICVGVRKLHRRSIMLKYILFAVMALLLVCNYLSKKILNLILKRQASQNEEMAYKLILYVITLAVVIYVMIIG